MPPLRLLLLAGILAASASGLGWAKTLADPRREESAARKHIERGLRELEADRLPQAREQLEQAYARAPLPEILYHLGRIAERQHEEIATADFYRRYLATLPDDAHPELRSRVQEILARVRDKASELDISSEDLGALLSIDRRVVGTLPLAAPLLISAGEHRFKLIKGAQEFETNSLTIPFGQHVQLQVAIASRYAVLTLLSGIALLFEPADAPKTLTVPLEKMVMVAAPAASSFLIDRDKTAAAVSGLSVPRGDSCARRIDCQEQLARALDASLVLVLAFDPSAAAVSRFTGRLFDAGTGMPVGSIESEVPSTTIEELHKLAAGRIPELLNSALNRGRGTLQVTSEPAGARVLFAGRELGRTPYAREAFEGPLEIVLELDGYKTQEISAKIKRGEATDVAATLEPILEEAEPVPMPLILPVAPKPTPPKLPPRRPLWRLSVGGVTLAAGLILGGFGASALAVSGQCITPATMPAELCDYAYGTRAVGGGLLGAGVALTAGGVLLLAWPGK